MSDQETAKRQNDTHLAKRKRILERIEARGVTVKAAPAWKVYQLQYLDEATEQMERQHQDELNDALNNVAAYKLQAQYAEQIAAGLRKELDALRALEIANWSKKEPATRWPEEGTTVDDQARIAGRLLQLSRLTGRPMVELLEQCRDVASQYRLQTWNALAAVEKMAGFDWDEVAQDYARQMELGLDV